MVVFVLLKPNGTASHRSTANQGTGETWFRGPLPPESFTDEIIIPNLRIGRDNRSKVVLKLHLSSTNLLPIIKFMFSNSSGLLPPSYK